MNHFPSGYVFAVYALIFQIYFLGPHLVQFSIAQRKGELNRFEICDSDCGFKGWKCSSLFINRDAETQDCKVRDSSPRGKYLSKRRNILKTISSSHFSFRENNTFFGLEQSRRL